MGRRKVIMFMRHAEKPPAEGGPPGRTELGFPTRHGLSLDGWRRAHEMVALFGTPAGRAAGLLAPPRVIFAAASTPERPSTRSVDTVRPLARALAVPLRSEPAWRRDPARLAKLLRKVDGPALVCWSRADIPDLLRGLGVREAPARWPKSLYDQVWVAVRRRGKWRLRVVKQARAMRAVRKARGAQSGVPASTAKGQCASSAARRRAPSSAS